MRRVLAKTICQWASDEALTFLTGDLGFNALEELRDSLGKRFINCGVAEQNMVSVAAGLAKTGQKPWTYSIAPFIYARAFEQIRNDVALHNLPVVLVGNGGGYAYGVMGSTHHALEDYGVMSTLPGLTCYVPCFDSDVGQIVSKLVEAPAPAYLRLGRDEAPTEYHRPNFAPWRRLVEGSGEKVIVACGPIAGSLVREVLAISETHRPSLWVVSQLPVAPESLPGELIEELRQCCKLIISEEHVAQGGLAQMLSLALLEHSLAPPKVTHLHAKGYFDGRMGSQAYHREQSGLSPHQIHHHLAEV